VKQRRAAAPYAKALFALAKERNQTEPVGRELGDLVAALGGSAELRSFFAEPWITATAKRTVATEVARRSGLSKLVGDFVSLLAERGRTDHLEAIAEKYQALMDEDLHRVRARVRSAVALTDEERGLLAATLERALGSQQVLLEEIVDGTMLGGVIVESGGVVLDGSLQGQLERIRRRLGGS
jgi:F-type H+-transporting ATPase subunit delta